jgi:L-asparaginase
MRHSDAAFNIGLALGALPVLPGGIYIANNGQVHASNGVRKDPALGRFVTPA